MDNTRYIDEHEVARITGRALSTLRNERFQHRGISFYKIGRSVRYRLGDVIEFMEKHRIETEPHAGQNPSSKELRS